MDLDPAVRRRFVGVSTKMYLGYQQSVDWLRGVRAELDVHDAAVAAGPDPDSGSGAGSTAVVTAFIAPSFPVLESAARILHGSSAVLAAQNCSASDGPVTGEVSAAMLAEVGVGIVEIGHAERRRAFGETDDVIARKVDAALAAELVPLLCIGEPERTAPPDAAAHCHRQVLAALGGRPPSRVLLAYEPVWAIGAPEPAPADYVNAVLGALRALLGDAPDAVVHILYGGSAGPGLLPRLSAADGLFLGRFAHDPHNFGVVLHEARALPRG